MTNNTLLALKDVTAGYGDVQVLWGLTFAVREAEIATLVGANGAGKSTALKTISGVVRAAAGQITFAGERIRGPFEGERDCDGRKLRRKQQRQ